MSKQRKFVDQLPISELLTELKKRYTTKVSENKKSIKILEAENKKLLKEIDSPNTKFSPEDIVILNSQSGTPSSKQRFSLAAKRAQATRRKNPISMINLAVDAMNKTKRPMTIEQLSAYAKGQGYKSDSRSVRDIMGQSLSDNHNARRKVVRVGKGLYRVRKG